MSTLTHTEQLPVRVSARRSLGERVDTLPSFTGVLVLLVLLVIVFCIAADGFSSASNIRNILGDSSILAVLAIGMTPTILSGGIDLSIASNAVLSAVVVVMVADGRSVIIGVLAGLAISTLVGLTNGFLIAVVKLNAFVVTLAGLQAYRGLARLLPHDRTNTLSGSAFSDLVNKRAGPVTVPVWLLLVATVAVVLLLRRTYWGRNVYAIGGNERAALLAGIPASRTKVLVYALSGFMAGVAALLVIGFNAQSASPSVLGGFELTAAAAVLLGGASLTGGSGGVVGSVIAVIFFTALSKGLNLMGITASYWQLIISGVLLVLAVALDRLRASSA